MLRGGRAPAEIPVEVVKLKLVVVVDAGLVVADLFVVIDSPAHATRSEVGGVTALCVGRGASRK